jgi:hypothetical protein
MSEKDPGSPSGWEALLTAMLRLADTRSKQSAGALMLITPCVAYAFLVFTGVIENQWLAFAIIVLFFVGGMWMTLSMQASVDDASAPATLRTPDERARTDRIVAIAAPNGALQKPVEGWEGEADFEGYNSEFYETLIRMIKDCQESCLIVGHGFDYLHGEQSSRIANQYLRAIGNLADRKRVYRIDYSNTTDTGWHDWIIDMARYMPFAAFEARRGLTILKPHDPAGAIIKNMTVVDWNRETGARAVIMFPKGANVAGQIHVRADSFLYTRRQDICQALAQNITEAMCYRSGDGKFIPNDDRFRRVESADALLDAYLSEEEAEQQRANFDELRRTEVVYFAYGSNLHQERMKARAEKPERIGCAILEGWQLEVARPALPFADNVVTIRRAEGSQVIGVLYRINGFDRQRLDFYEGVKDGAYRQIDVAVTLLEGGGERHATTYILESGPPAGRLREGYTAYIVEGLDDVAAQLPTPGRRFVEDYIAHSVRPLAESAADGPAAR